jgi:hypothetical protein
MTGCCLWCGYCNVRSGFFDLPFSLWAKYRNTETQQSPATVSKFVTDEFVMFYIFIIIVNTHCSQICIWQHKCHIQIKHIKMSLHTWELLVFCKVEIVSASLWILKL